MTAGDVRLLVAYVVLWLAYLAMERWISRRADAREARAAARAAALASQQRFLDRLDTLRAEFAQSEGAGFRLEGEASDVADQLIETTRPFTPRRSEA